MLFITSFKDNGTNSVKTKILIKEFKLLSRITKFTESHYFMPYYIQQLEARGLQGDFILVEGMRTGSALVKARIKDRAYKVWISVKKKIKFTSFLYYLACKYSPLTKFWVCCSLCSGGNIAFSEDNCDSQFDHKSSRGIHTEACYHQIRCEADQTELYAG